MNRRTIAALAIALAAVALGWALMTGLSRILRSSAAPDPVDAPVQAAVPRDACGPAHQGDALFRVGRWPGPRTGRTRDPARPRHGGAGAGDRRSAARRGRARRACRDDPARHEAARRLCLGAQRSLHRSRQHRAREASWGSVNELFTVFTIVNAVATNLPDVQEVQLLIDGHEVDTLAGHVDLRRPLRKNERSSECAKMIAPPTSFGPQS